MKYSTVLSTLCFCSCAAGQQGSSSDGGRNNTASSSLVASTGSDGGTMSSSQQGQAQVCVPGSTQLCNGPGACFGAQTCRIDGLGYDACICSESVAQTTGPSTSTTTTTTTAAGPSTSSGGDFTCDPMSPGAACGPGKQCLPQSNGDPVCAQAGNGNFFDLCVDFSQCLPGLDCVNDGMNSCCMAWCRRGYNDCPTSFTCVEVLGNPTVDGVIYGVCWDGYPCVL
jgi:hypothetical protein